MLQTRPAFGRSLPVLFAVATSLTLHAVLWCSFGAADASAVHRGFSQQETPATMTMLNDASPTSWRPAFGEAVEPVVHQRVATASPAKGPADAAAASEAPTTTVVAYDVAPIPLEGWNVGGNVSDPAVASADAVVRIEVEVSASGAMRRWRVVESTLPVAAAEAMLSGIETTVMLPAVARGQAVDAVAEYELRFVEPVFGQP